MKTIEVDDEVYEYLRLQTSFIGEDASSILRRLLHIPDSESPAISFDEPSNRPLVRPDLTVQSDSPTPIPEEQDPVDAFLRSTHFINTQNVTDRYLEVLAWVYRSHRDRFTEIRNITGRQRVYFSTSQAEIANAGNATQPHRIPSTPWFAMTNNDTPNKLRLLRDVMRLFQYHVGDIDKVVWAVEHEPDGVGGPFQI